MGRARALLHRGTDGEPGLAAGLAAPARRVGPRTTVPRTAIPSIGGTPTSWLSSPGFDTCAPHPSVSATAPFPRSIPLGEPVSRGDGTPNPAWRPREGPRLPGCWQQGLRSRPLQPSGREELAAPAADPGRRHVGQRSRPRRCARCAAGSPTHCARACGRPAARAAGPHGAGGLRGRRRDRPALPPACAPDGLHHPAPRSGRAAGRPGRRMGSCDGATTGATGARPVRPRVSRPSRTSTTFGTRETRWPPRPGPACGS